MYDVRSTTMTPASGAARSLTLDSPRRVRAWSGHLAHDQLAMILGIPEHRLQRLGAFEVEVQVVFPGEADAAVHLDGVAADLARGLAHVRLADGGGDGGVLGARVERPRRVVHGRMGVLHGEQHLRAAMPNGLKRPDRLPELLAHF